MGFLGFGKKKGVIDLGERYRKEQERAERIREDAKPKQTPSKYENSISSDAISFFADKMAKEQTMKEKDSEGDEYSDEEKKKKLAKRLMDMTDKIENLSNQIYHLQQRIEVLEQRLRVGVGS